VNLTNKQLKRIIREELNLLDEQEQGQEQPTTPTTPQRANVKRVSKKLEKVAGLDELLAGLKSRQDLIQFIWGQVLQKISGNISKQDIGAALKTLLAQVAKSKSG
jgi:hypothetical protein